MENIVPISQMEKKKGLRKGKVTCWYLKDGIKIQNYLTASSDFLN